MITLSPVQQRAYEELLAVLQPGVCATLAAGAGAGKSTVLRAAHASLGGAWLDARELVEAHSWSTCARGTWRATWTSARCRRSSCTT